MISAPDQLEFTGVMVMAAAILGRWLYALVRGWLWRKAVRVIENDIVYAAAFVVMSVGLGMIGAERGLPIVLPALAGAALGVPVFWWMRLKSQTLLEPPEESEKRRDLRATLWAVLVFLFMGAVIVAGLAALMLWGRSLVDNLLILLFALAPAMLVGFALHAAWVSREERNRGGRLYRVSAGHGPLSRPSHIELKSRIANR